MTEPNDIAKDVDDLFGNVIAEAEEADAERYLNDRRWRELVNMLRTTVSARADAFTDVDFIDALQLAMRLVRDGRRSPPKSGPRGTLAIDPMTGEPVDERPIDVRLADTVEPLFIVDLERRRRAFDGAVKQCATCAQCEPAIFSDPGNLEGFCRRDRKTCQPDDFCAHWQPMTCATCSFWTPPNEVTAQGRCVNAARRNQGAHIVTTANDHCDRWEAKR